MISVHNFNNHVTVIYISWDIQDSYRSGKTGKSRGICVVRERSGENIIFEKSGEVILDHADCGYL